MSTTYQLVNVTKQETLKYVNLSVSKTKEIATNAICAAMTTWYLLQNPGDIIGFVSEVDLRWPLPSGSWEELNGYTEITEDLIAQLINAEILEDKGSVFIDNNPDLIQRNLKVIDTA